MDDSNKSGAVGKTAENAASTALTSSTGIPKPLSDMLVKKGLERSKKKLKLAAIGCLFPLVFVIVAGISVVGTKFSSIEGYYGSGGSSSGKYGTKITDDWAAYKVAEQERQTFYKKLSELVSDYKIKGRTIDETLILSIMFYESPANINANYSCIEQSIEDEEGNVVDTDCNNDSGSAVNANKLYKEAKNLAKKMASTSEEEFKQWLYDDYVEDMLKDQGVKIPSSGEEKEKLFNKTIDEIYSLRDMYVDFTFDKQSTVSECGAYEEVKLCDTGNSHKDIAYAEQNWAKGTGQYEIWNRELGSSSKGIVEGKNSYGELKSDEQGFYYIESGGTKYYCNAMASYYTVKIGDKFRITLENGSTFHIIIADQKANIHTIKGNNDESPNCISSSGSMLEFYMKRSLAQNLIGTGGINRDFGDGRNFQGAVTKVEKLIGENSCGGIIGLPNFSKIFAWLPPHNAYPIGQCTWFVAGRLYELYGTDYNFNFSGSSGNGKNWVSSLTSRYPDKFKFSATPIPGAIFSASAVISGNYVQSEWGHVGIVVSYDGKNITVQEGNLNGSTDSFEVGITDWWEHTYSIESFNQIYNNPTYAAPVN